MSIVTRFAPSPTGLAHLGHAFSALTAWSKARAAGGRFLLRLEDIDPMRCQPAYAAAMLEDLAWLGLDCDGPVRVQSAHMPEYAAVLEALRERGLLYPCFCSRADIQRHVVAAAPHGPVQGAAQGGGAGALYPGTCRRLPADERAARMREPHAWRLDMARALIPGLAFEEAPLTFEEAPLTFEEEGEGMIQADPARFGDVVLARKDTPSSYHLCVTHDDAVQGVTLVTRGEDLKDATHLHRLLQALMGWPTPVYAHHRLLTDASGRRLAKRDHAQTLRDLREEGVTPAEIRARLGFGEFAAFFGQSL